ncbi:hypothetical protein MTR_1g053785 [Medicago truncatula]|uniref:Uncharacterized protein n=1 Tax=Medicago truncatula TaxID=3880 RepID=A0A072VI31_MEDTR|nr:hypothetical protein MTR_1g053785 [Medicago truncatula]
MKNWTGCNKAVTTCQYSQSQRGRSPGKMLKALATGRLPGAESPANLLIANDPARGLAPGKCAPGKGPGSTPGKLFLQDCRLCRLCQHHINHFQNMSGTLRGVNNNII